MLISKIIKAIFSINNEMQQSKHYKVFRILGFKIKFRDKNKEFLDLLKNIDSKYTELSEKIEYEFNNIRGILNNKDYVSIKKEINRIVANESASYVLEKMPMIKRLSTGFEVLDYALTNTLLDGLYLEFGVYSATTINHISSQVPNIQIYGFDSFEGLPEDWRAGFEKGVFAVDNLPKVNKNVTLIRGWFNESLPKFLDNHPEQCAFIHVDCDLYSSATTVLDLLHNRIKSGTVIVFDEYFNYPGWQNGEFKAFEEFCDKYSMKYEYIAFNEQHEQCAVKIL